MITFAIPLPPMSKARPRVTKRGTYMPKPYMAWRRSFALHFATQRPLVTSLPITSPVRVGTIFHTPTGNCRGDLDNCHATVLDALQDCGVLANDRQVKAGAYGIERRPAHLILITIEPTEEP